MIFGHQVEQGLQVNAIGQRINGCRHLAIRNLYEAQYRPIGVFAHKFGVDGDKISIIKTRT